MSDERAFDALIEAAAAFGNSGALDSAEVYLDVDRLNRAFGIRRLPPIADELSASAIGALDRARDRGVSLDTLAGVIVALYAALAARDVGNLADRDDEPDGGR